MKFSPEFFQRINFKPEQIRQYFESSKKDFNTASESKNPDVILHFCYNSIIKLGIGLIAKEGYKVRSIPGHHIKILEGLGGISSMKEEVNYIQRIRRKRNLDLYEGGISLSEKEAKDLLKITKSLLKEGDKNGKHGFTLVELIVSVAITSIIMLGMSVFFSSVLHSNLNTQERLSDIQGQFVLNEIVRTKFQNVNKVISPALPSDNIVTQNDMESGDLPFSYIGKEGPPGDERVVMKDFFMFNGILKDALSVTSGLNNPGGIFRVGPSSYYITSPGENKIYACNPITSCSNFPINEHLSHPTDIVSVGSFLYISDSGNDRVIKVNKASGTIESTFNPTQFNFPTGLAYYNSGVGGQYLFVSDTYNHQVKSIRLDGMDAGKTVVIVGEGDNKDCDNSALYCKPNFPTGLHVEGNNLYIADTGNNRILKMSEPELTEDVASPLTIDFSIGSGFDLETIEFSGDFSGESMDASTNLAGTQYAAGVYTNVKAITNNTLPDCDLSVNLYTNQDLGPLTFNIQPADQLVANGVTMNVTSYVGNTECEPVGPTYAYSTSVNTPPGGSGGDDVFGVNPDDVSFVFTNIEFTDGGFQKITAETYSDGAILEDTDIITVRVGNGMIGGAEDTIEVLVAPVTGLIFPTDISIDPASPLDIRVADSLDSGVKSFDKVTGALNSSDPLTAYTTPFTSPDYISDFTVQSLSFSEPNPGDLLELTVVADVENGDPQTYTINAELRP